jgi:hypothetical protein
MTAFFSPLSRPGKEAAALAKFAAKNGFGNVKKLAHEDDHAPCDLCVCWIHDYPDCPVEVLELRKVLKTLPNPPFCPPDSQATRN